MVNGRTSRYAVPLNPTRSTIHYRYCYDLGCQRRHNTRNFAVSRDLRNEYQGHYDDDLNTLKGNGIHRPHLQISAISNRKYNRKDLHGHLRARA
jgi:hypothetical protein